MPFNKLENSYMYKRYRVISSLGNCCGMGEGVYTNMTPRKWGGGLVWNAKLTETRIFRELSIEIQSSLIELKSSLIELESSLIQLESSLIQLLSSLYMYNKRAH